MEEPLEASSARIKTQKRWSFNPYFDGRAFGSVAVKVDVVVWFKFQSLFRWKSLWKNGIKIFTLYIQKVSILISMEEPLEVANSVSILVASSGFNPYFDGRAFGRIDLWDTKQRVILFQSLFRWKSLWKLANSVSILVASSGFNPYFDGRAFGRSRFVRYETTHCFVSILISMEEPLEERFTDESGIAGSKFQSLFRWKSLWKSPSLAL